MKKTLLNSVTALTLATAVAGVMLIGCKDTDYPTPQPLTTGFLTTARVLIANASDATGITAFLENVSVGSTLVPGANTGYVSAPVSVDQIRVKGTGGTLGTNDIVVKSTVAANTNYTVFVTDTVNRPQVINSLSRAVTDVGGARLLVVTDPLTQTLTAGSGGVRFFHFAPDVGAVSLRLVPTSPASVTAVQSINNRTYRTVTATAFNSVPAGTYTAQVFSGTATPAISSTIAPVISLSGVTVEAAKYYTLYAQGLARRRTLSVGRIQHN